MQLYVIQINILINNDSNIEQVPTKKSYQHIKFVLNYKLFYTNEIGKSSAISKNKRK